MPDPLEVWRWRQTNVSAQKQAGFVVVAIVLVLGDVTASQLRTLASLAERYGDGTVRMTPGQNVFLRWVREADLLDLFVDLAAAGLATPGAGTITDVTSCPGAETCRLAVTQSRGLARLLRSHFEASAATVESAADLQIRISGCPNGCGQHHVAGIGFQGSVRKVAGRALPMYFVTVGGASDGDGARFGRLAAKVPAHRCGEAVDRLVSLYAREARAGEGATAFFQRVPVEQVTAAIGDVADLSGRPPADHEFIDPGDEAAFNPEVLDGECSA
jgi:sulfite reductase (NADPH) hemoprotein beta-component